MLTPIRHLNVGSLLVAAMMAMATSSANAIVLGNNITIPDNNNDGSNPAVAGNWYSNREDNETENTPNTITTQVWDLEGMYLNGKTLTLVGGFDFQNGVLHNGHTYRGGDLFIDLTGDAKFGASSTNNGTGGSVANSFGYELALDIAGASFTAFQLNPASLVNRATDVGSSNPWTYASGGNNTGLTGSVTYGTLSGADVTTYGLLGDGGNNVHYFMALDLTNVQGLLNTTSETFHYTMECGNDDLMGRHVPDGGAAILLLGVSLTGLEMMRRKMRIG
jgi:hypothetical protein